MPFPQAPAGARRIFGRSLANIRQMAAIRLALVLWEVILWCSPRMTKWSSPPGSGRGRRGTSERRVQSRSTPSEAKPGSLWTYGPGSATGYLIAPEDHHTLQHIQVHFGVDFQADFEDLRWHDVAITGNHTKDHNRSRKLFLHHRGHVPVILGNPDLHLRVLVMVLLS